MGKQGNGYAGKVPSPVGFSPRGPCRGPGRSRLFPPCPPAAPQAGTVLLAGLIYLFFFFCNAPPCYKCQSSRCPASWTPQPSRAPSTRLEAQPWTEALPHPSRCRGAVRGRPQSSVHPFHPFPPPGSSSQALQQPVSTCLRLSLSSIISLSGAGSVSASHALPIFGFQGLRWVFSLPCDCSAGEGFVRAGLGESLWVYNVLLKSSFLASSFFVDYRVNLRKCLCFMWCFGGEIYLNSCF